MDLERLGIDLRRRLQRVAAIDKDRGAVLQHDRHPGRAGEAGEPGEALAAQRHVFALMLVGARHDKASELLLGQLFAQQHEPFGAGQALEIFRLHSVAMIDRQRRLERLQTSAASAGGHRLDDKRVPARPDLGRRGEHAGDQRLDRGDVERANPPS